MGLILATAIRLEFAYPGVGIFAGDSLQYLTVASAHGVIMVFFMIMPLLFGAFANFLLPTQLGVHDVAFPRLNSAAFWFLPGGLIMLIQMICVDRRYQRMNCFNVREIEALLKEKFFTELNDDIIWTHKLPISLSALRFQQNGTYTDLAPSFSTSITGPKNITTFRSQKVLTLNLNTKVSEEKIKGTPFATIWLNNIPSVSPIFWLIISRVTTGWLFLLSLIMGILQCIKGVLLLVYDCLTHLILFPHNLRQSFSSTDIKSLNKTYTILEDNIYQLTTPLYYPTNSFFGTYIYSTQRFDSYFNYLVYIYPLKECTILAYEFNGLVFDWVWLLVFNMYLIYYNRESYLSDIPIQILIHLQSYNNIYFEIRNWFTVIFLFLFKMENLTMDAKMNSVNEIAIIMQDSKHNQFLLFNKLTVFLMDMCELIATLVKYLIFLILNVDFSIQFVPFKQFVLWTLNEPVLFSKLHQNVAVSMLTNVAELGRINGNLKYTDLTIIPLLDLSYSSRNTFLDVFSLITHPTNFSNFVDTYYIYVTGFYEVHRMRKTYFPIFSRSDSILTSNTVHYWNKIVNFVEKISIILLIGIETLYDSFNFKQERGWVVLSSIIYLFSRESYKQISIFMQIHPIKDFFSVPHTPFNWLNIIRSNFSKFFTDFVNFLSYRKLVRYSDVYSSMTIFSTIKFKLIEMFPLYQELKKDDRDSIFKLEHTHSTRHVRFSNPLLKYDYKTGDYFPKTSREQNIHLFPSLLSLSSSTPIAPWFTSQDMKEMLPLTYEIFSNTYNLSMLRNDPTRLFSYDNTPTSIFYAFATPGSITTSNSPFASWSALNQQFYRLFLTSSMQQRVLTNWRQLKFTREAWRCKLLSARHQKTLYRRYLNEDGVFWSIERNARDLLPGWAMITPFSSRTRFTAVGKVDIGLMGVLLVLNSSIISAANFLVTYRYLSSLNNRKMRDARSFFAEGVMVASWMMIAANPMLVIGIIMLLSDRHWQTSFFDYSGGGDTILFQHMFWFFGHPEVYIILIPVFGFTNTTLSYYLRKRVSARASLMYSMYTIAFLGFFVWGHHMYMVGLAHTTRMLFSTLTVMISVPAATKLMHWCVTIANSSFVVELPLLFTLTFIFLFVSGGISGMCVAHTGMDVLFHDTFYVIGHFHVMLAGAAMFGSFGAFYFYFSAIFGVKYSRLYSYLHYAYYLTGQIVTVAPMFWLGYAGMPRRVLDYPASLGGWHSLISGGHLLSVAGIISFFIMIFDSLRQARAALRTTLGINRYNTRLSFYLFEISRLKVVKQKFGYLFNFIFKKMLILKRRPLAYFEEYESTLITYTFRSR